MIKILTSLCLLTVFAFPATASDDYTEELYELYCHSCHGVKGSGAPLAFNQSEWKPYLKKGINKLIDNAISGIGNMPAMGTCSECGPEELQDLIEFMSKKEK